jgi:hypothetical protein
VASTLTETPRQNIVERKRPAYGIHAAAKSSIRHALLTSLPAGYITSHLHERAMFDLLPTLLKNFFC